MIVPMSKVYIVTQTRHQDELLNAMGKVGVVHVAPIDAAKAVAQDNTLEAMADVTMAVRILEGISPSGKAPDVSSLDAAREAIALQRLFWRNVNNLRPSIARQIN
jgi:vacuolar-type H+-ATPase subunit I/STV1